MTLEPIIEGINNEMGHYINCNLGEKYCKRCKQFLKDFGALKI